MSDEITVNVDDLRAATDMSAPMPDWCDAHKKLRAALAEHDKAEQERNNKRVFIHHDDLDAVEPWVYLANIHSSWYLVDTGAVDALGEFHPHQTDHAYEGNRDQACNVVCWSDLDQAPYNCMSPEWAHTPRAVPDWQTDETVLVVKDKHGERWVRSNAEADRWWPVGGEFAESWSEVLEEGAPITPVGWRRDPDSIVIPKSELERTDSSHWRDQAINLDLAGFLRASRLANAIADALEAAP